LFHLLTIAGVIALLGQSAPRHEPIHPADRVFTADEFRQHLNWIRGQQKILDAVQNSKLSPEEQRKMADFAQRLLKKSQEPGDKANLPIPPKLLNDPAIQKLMNDEKFMEWIANNERMQKMAERLASKFRMPNPTSPPPPRPNAGGMNSRNRSEQSLNNLNRTGNDPTRPNPGEDSRSQAKRSASAANRSNGLNNNRPDSSNDSRNDDVASDGPDPNGRMNGNEGINGEFGVDANKGKPGNRPEEGQAEPGRHPVLRRMTDAMRKVGPLQNSPTLDRVDDLMGKEPSIPDRLAKSALPTAPSNQWMEKSLAMSTEWLDSPWVKSLPSGLENIPLPGGWENAILPLDKIPMPAFPNSSLAFPSNGIVNLPSMGLSATNPMSARNLVSPFVFLVVAAITFLLLRSLLTGELGLSKHRRSAMNVATKPSLPFDPRERDSVRQWFEYIALRRLGHAARAQTHAQLASSLALSPDTKASATRFAEMYEKARYLPPHETLEDSLAHQAEEDLARLNKDDRPSR
jgi:hypothetical protein